MSLKCRVSAVCGRGECNEKAESQAPGGEGGARAVAGEGEGIGR